MNHFSVVNTLSFQLHGKRLKISAKQEHNGTCVILTNASTQQLCFWADGVQKCLQKHPHFGSGPLIMAVTVA